MGRARTQNTTLDIDMDLGLFNSQRASLLIQTLQTLGISYFCLSPGSRNTPLSIALSSLAKEDVCIHFDERGLGFHAVGYGKGSYKKSAAALFVTSGTAVANLVPSIAEAAESHTPLLVITADRPPELRSCGANQTMEQTKLLAPFVRFQVDLPFSDPLFSSEALVSTLSYAIDRACNSTQPGPVHINCMIREPSFSFHAFEELRIPPCRYEPLHCIPSDRSLEEWAKQLSSIERGVILLGSDAIEQDVFPLLSMAQKLGWPILSDIISGGRQIGEHPHHMLYGELFLKAHPDIEVEAILHIGDRLVSKVLSQWSQKQKNISYFLVTATTSLYDPLKKVTHKITASPQVFCQKIAEFLPQARASSWLSLWQSGSSIIKETLTSYFACTKHLSEPAIAYTLQGTQALYLSNSMPVRDADLLLFPSDGVFFSASNRGVAGSDGNIATAIGIAKALQKPLVVLLGDIALLHDMNSLALWSKSLAPITFLVINNGGGGIFSFLPVSERRDIVETFFATAHSYSFSSIANLFSIPYQYIDSWEDWKQIEELVVHPTKTQIIECRTSREQNVKDHENLHAKIQECLCSSLSLWEIKDSLSLCSYTVS